MLPDLQSMPMLFLLCGSFVGSYSTEKHAYQHPAFTASRQGLDFALDVSMLFDFDVADFRELQLAVQFESALRIRETVVTVVSFEPRESSFLPTLDSTEERFVGFVQTAQRILQHL